MKKQGLFINLEGIDGSGKTSVSKKLVDYFNAKEMPIYYVDRKSLDYNSDYLKKHMKGLSDLIWSEGEVFKQGPNSRLDIIPLEHWFFFNSLVVQSS